MAKRIKLSICHLKEKTGKSSALLNAVSMVVTQSSTTVSQRLATRNSRLCQLCPESELGTDLAIPTD